MVVTAIVIIYHTHHITNIHAKEQSEQTIEKEEGRGDRSEMDTISDTGHTNQSIIWSVGSEGGACNTHHEVFRTGL